MHLAKVIGTVVASQKAESLKGVKLLLIQPLNDKLENKGEPIVAVDPNMRAGEGCVVSYVTGREAMLALPIPNAAVDAGIVGIVDEPINREER
jgi:ethanolamine utilization protein EutN